MTFTSAAKNPPGLLHMQQHTLHAHTCTDSPFHPQLSTDSFKSKDFTSWNVYSCFFLKPWRGGSGKNKFMGDADSSQENNLMICHEWPHGGQGSETPRKKNRKTERREGVFGERKLYDWYLKHMTLTYETKEVSGRELTCLAMLLWNFIIIYPQKTVVDISEL